MEFQEERIQRLIIKATGADLCNRQEVIQQLWSGYGEIVRYQLQGCNVPSVVVKHIQFPNSKNHPRGWNSNLSHERKVKSYDVECNWYVHFASQCTEGCRVPQCLLSEKVGDEVILILEDLDASGFASRSQSISFEQVKWCLEWLANFHAKFLHTKPEGLWSVGTYWHLETRPEELECLDDLPLKSAASVIDETLSATRYKTLVHGDAKLANFCFQDSLKCVSAVDFQYVGGGCGMKDVAYFIGSCMNETDCEEYENKVLDFYFKTLKMVSNMKPEDFNELEREWRKLYPVAWTDFHRFLKGWSPGHWKINSYSERVSRETISKLMKS